MAADIQPLLEKLTRLGANSGRLKTLVGNIQTLTERLEAAQDATLRLDSLAKDYDSNLNRLAGVQSALQIQLTQAEHDLDAEVLRVEAEAVRLDLSAGQYRARLKACDEDILAGMLLIWRKVIARKRLAQEHIEGNGILAALANDAGVAYHAVEPLNPWHVGSLPNDPEEAAAWLRRFADMAMRTSQIPENPDDLLTWFSRSRY